MPFLLMQAGIVMCVYEEIIGGIPLRMEAESGCLVKIDFLARLPEKPRQDEDEVLAETRKQLQEYFAARRKIFSIPLRLQGTEFQCMVWRELQRIPYGETASYGDIAKRIGRPKAVRAIGMANHRNKIPLIIPCHRVIGADGSLTGYAGGLELKKMLLEIEKTNNYN